ncbi:hypothetical protein [Synechocystis sp. PCC 6714]|uniref:hypothetical protein n=1 Tax=Synechocystis sp. (strain PCC 6714) TaxID=1147 RepID=UPI0004007D52|nr:hypothetical protein [Synechocystis sp. PCC 6714]AIE75851.1 hypothetical protein D082_33230 [Synechocystis sp. PCC 6714]
MISFQTQEKATKNPPERAKTEFIVDLIESKTLTRAKSVFGKDFSRLNLTLIGYKSVF